MTRDDEDAAQNYVKTVNIAAPTHSIINELSKLLIRMPLAAALQTFTVTSTVNLSGTSIGAGLRAVQPKVTFRDLSTSIDPSDECQRHLHASVSVGEASEKHRHQTS